MSGSDREMVSTETDDKSAQNAEGNYTKKTQKLIVKIDKKLTWGRKNDKKDNI